MSIDEQGHLSPQIQEIISNNLVVHKDLFAYIEELNIFIQKQKFNFDFTPIPSEKEISISIFIKILNSFQASYLLCQRNLEDDAKAIIRSSFEHMIYLFMIYQDDDFASKFIESDFLKRKKAASVIFNDKHDCFTTVTKNLITEEYVKSIDELINSKNIKDLGSFEYLSKKCGLIKYYNLVYRNFSNSVHPDPRNLEKYAIFDKNILKEFTTIPYTNTIEFTLMTSVDILLLSLEKIIDLVKLDIKEQVISFRLKINSIISKYNI
jgi:hypothetical protein